MYVIVTQVTHIHNFNYEGEENYVVWSRLNAMFSALTAESSCSKLVMLVFCKFIALEQPTSYSLFLYTRLLTVKVPSRGGRYTLFSCISTKSFKKK